MKEILTQLHHLYSITVVNRNLAWYMTNGLISPEGSEEVSKISAQLCKDISPQSLALTDAFALTDNMISAPIALDWIKYNEYDNQGEL